MNDQVPHVKPYSIPILIQFLVSAFPSGAGPAIATTNSHQRPNVGGKSIDCVVMEENVENEILKTKIELGLDNKSGSTTTRLECNRTITYLSLNINDADKHKKETCLDIKKVNNQTCGS